MKRRFTKALAIFAAFCVAFTSLPMLTGGLNASAASYWSNVSGKANGQTSVTLSWKQLSKKQRKKIGGITVFRNGAAAANLSKTAKGFTDTGLKAGTSYTYQVKTYKKVTKKTKMWLNKKTGQWQKKKPAKKYRGKKKTFKKISYKYSNASKTVTVRTASGVSASKPASGSGTNYASDFLSESAYLKDCAYDIANMPSTYEYGNGTVVFEIECRGTTTWTSSNTTVATIESKYSGKQAIMHIKSVGKTTITATHSSGNNKSFVVTVYNSANGDTPGGGGTTPTPTYTYEYKEVTDYLGVTRKIRKRSDLDYWETYEGSSFVVSPMIRYDRTLDGTFTDDGVTYLQENNVTFNKTQLDNPTYRNTSPYVEMYNGDFNKLTLTVRNTMSSVDTYDYEKKPIELTYVMQDGMRLARYNDIVTETSGKKQIKRIRFIENDTSTCDGTGFVKGNITIDVAYNNKPLATWNIGINQSAGSNGLSPLRQKCWEIASAAIDKLQKENPSAIGNYRKEMHAISNYILNNYVYEENVGSGLYLNCNGGRLVLETYSILAHNTYGFISYGGYDASADPNLHGAFHLNTNIDEHYEAQGH